MLEDFVGNTSGDDIDIGGLEILFGAGVCFFRWMNLSVSGVRGIVDLGSVACCSAWHRTRSVGRAVGVE